MRANPERKEFNERVPIKSKPFNGSFADKNKIKKLKSICDAAFLLVISIEWGTEVNYSEFKPTVKDGYAEIIFDNTLNIVMQRSSETAFHSFQSIFLAADRIDIRRKDFWHTAIRLYVNDIWVDMNTSLNMERDDLLLPNEVHEFWESIKNDDSSAFLVQKDAVKAVVEDDKYVGSLIDFLYSYDENYTNATIPAKFVDKSIFPKVMADFNIVKDALLNLHYNHGIGVSIETEYIDEEMSNRIKCFYVRLTCVNSAFFDTNEKMKLLKRCIRHCCGFEINTKGETGNITLVIQIENKHRY
jgi:hypothetical protein